MTRWTASSDTVRRVALITVVVYALLVVSGGAVRLTGSGLGCPDWPSCYHHQLQAAASFHPLVEFVNRCITVSVSILSIVAAGLALSRRHRKDVWLPALGLIVGLAAEIVIGGIVVLSKLNPYLVAAHFLLTFVVIADAVVMYHRATIPDALARVRPSRVAGEEVRRYVQLLLLELAALTALGTMVTGAGPHAGAPGTERVPVSFRDIAEAHSDLAWLLVGLVTAGLFIVRHAGAPAVVQHRMRTMFELVIMQGALGYTQYFLHDNPVVVEFHLAGVTSIWLAAIFLYLSLHSHEQPVGDVEEAPVATVAAPTPLPAH